MTSDDRPSGPPAPARGLILPSDLPIWAPGSPDPVVYQAPLTAGSGSHAAGPSGGRRRLLALISGLVVLAALVLGGFVLFHSGPKTALVAGPTVSAAITAGPVAAGPVAVPAPAGAAPAPAGAAPAPAAPSPTADANLGGRQAKALQNTIIKPLKSLVALDASSAGAEESCKVDQTGAFQARRAERSALLAMLRRLDVTAMRDASTWKGLLEQAMIKDIAVDSELVSFARDLKATCDPSTAQDDPHYKKAIVNRKASVALQKKFVASFNPVARSYNIPMQSAGNL